LLLVSLMTKTSPVAGLTAAPERSGADGEVGDDGVDHRYRVSAKVGVLVPMLILWCEKVLQHKTGTKIMPGVFAGSDARSVPIWVYPCLGPRRKGYAEWQR
jgi:hypothetical protein